MKTWIWPFSWYSELRALRLQVAVLTGTIQKLRAENKKLEAEVISQGIAMQGLMSAYTDSMEGIYAVQRENWRREHAALMAESNRQSAMACARLGL